MYTLYYFFYNILDRAVTSRDVKQSVDLTFKMVRTIMAIDYYGKMIVEIFLIAEIKLNITQYRMQLKSKYMYMYCDHLNARGESIKSITVQQLYQ